MPKVVTSSLKWTWWCPSSSTILGVALIKSNLFLETFSCWNLFPEFLSDTPHITEFGKCQNVIWSDWILIWWSCIWKLRSTLKNYLCSQFAFLFSTKAVIPSFRSFVPKDACKIAAWANLTLFYAIQEFCCSSTSVDGTIQLRFMANKKSKNFERTRICWFHLEHPLLKSQALLQS